MELGTPAANAAKPIATTMYDGVQKRSSSCELPCAKSKTGGCVLGEPHLAYKFDAKRQVVRTDGASTAEREPSFDCRYQNRPTPCLYSACTDNQNEADAYARRNASEKKSLAVPEVDSTSECSQLLYLSSYDMFNLIHVLMTVADKAEEKKHITSRRKRSVEVALQSML